MSNTTDEPITIKRWTQSHDLIIECVQQRLMKNDRVYAHFLLDQILTKSRESQIYRNRVIAWINGDTQLGGLRELCLPFVGRASTNVVTMNKTSVIHKALLDVKFYKLHQRPSEK